MKKNPVIPYALIAVLGILAMIVLSFVGLDQQDEIANSGEQTEGEATASDPEAVFQNTCAGCHGADLSGGAGGAPSLQEVGSKYSQEEIQDIIMNGKGTGMPAGLVDAEQAEAIAAWLAEKK
ncbi:cytochrome c550 [Radiobacillus deserti]|uniref:C-type cytochrome n=1 Tax=Radiobacillus deserti TaxID=2594883 RepID=A0A516KGV3_9BACI|nr:cytochrome c [Radiobacillus deserti]QDP40631.1 c-type cytochrome [Radiobacillus deserti]